MSQSYRTVAVVAVVLVVKVVDVTKLRSSVNKLSQHNTRAKTVK
jgi:hypothetical protein